jgi:hypothetical protein
MVRAIAAYARRHHLALLALFVALGGTSVAAGNALLPRNSVGNAQLKNGAVTKTKIAKKTRLALRGNRGLRGLRGPAGAGGLIGPQGLQGIQGPPGLQGLQGPGAISFSTTVPQDANPHTLKTIAGVEVNVTCSAGATQLEIAAPGLTNTLDLSGTLNFDTTTNPIRSQGAPHYFIAQASPASLEMDLIARNTAVGQAFSRFDLHAGWGTPCTAWGMITPSTVG